MVRFIETKSPFRVVSITDLTAIAAVALLLRTVPVLVALTRQLTNMLALYIWNTFRYKQLRLNSLKKTSAQFFVTNILLRVFSHGEKVSFCIFSIRFSSTIPQFRSVMHRYHGRSSTCRSIH